MARDGRLDLSYYTKRLHTGSQYSTLAVDLFKGDGGVTNQTLVNQPTPTDRTNDIGDEGGITFEPELKQMDDGKLDDDSEDRFDGAAILAALAANPSKMTTDDKELLATFTPVVLHTQLSHTGKHAAQAEGTLQHKIHDMMADLLEKKRPNIKKLKTSPPALQIAKDSQQKSSSIQIQEAVPVDKVEWTDEQDDDSDSVRVICIGPKDDNTDLSVKIPDLEYSNGYKSRGPEEFGSTHTSAPPELLIDPKYSRLNDRYTLHTPQKGNMSLDDSNVDYSKFPKQTTSCMQNSNLATPPSTTFRIARSDQLQQTATHPSSKRESKRSKLKPLRQLKWQRHNDATTEDDSLEFSWSPTPKTPIQPWKKRPKKRGSKVASKMKGLFTTPLRLLDRYVRELLPGRKSGRRMRLARRAIIELAVLIEVYIVTVFKISAAVARGQDKKGTQKRMDRGHIERATADHALFDLLLHQMHIALPNFPSQP